MSKKQYTDKEVEILKNFKYRCVRCQRKFDTIHECVPRSAGKSSMNSANRVPICNACHTWAHQIGTSQSAPILLRLRTERLKQYVNN